MNRKATENRTPPGVLPEGVLRHMARDVDPEETNEWLEALDYVIASAGCER